MALCNKEREIPLKQLIPHGGNKPPSTQKGPNVPFFLGQEGDITERLEVKKLAPIDLNLLWITTSLDIYYKPNISL